MSGEGRITVGMRDPQAVSARAKALFLAGLALAVACSVSVGADGAAKKAPRISVDAKEFNFGRVPNDRGVEHVFTVSNTGDAPLVVSRVQTSCGCTAAMMESSVLKPGTSGRLRVSFNPQRMHQVVTRSITIYSNDPLEPQVILGVTADVVEAGEEKTPPKAPVWTHKKREKLVFTGECAECHSTKSATLTGARLYAAVCAVCHGSAGEGVQLGGERIGAPLKRDRMSVRTAAGIRQIVDAGTGHQWMPGFGKAYGGPLNEKQVASLVELIMRSFEKKK